MSSSSSFFDFCSDIWDTDEFEDNLSIEIQNILINCLNKISFWCDLEEENPDLYQHLTQKISAVVKRVLPEKEEKKFLKLLKNIE